MDFKLIIWNTTSANDYVILRSRDDTLKITISGLHKQVVEVVGQLVPNYREQLSLPKDKR